MLGRDGDAVGRVAGQEQGGGEAGDAGAKRWEVGQYAFFLELHSV